MCGIAGLLLDREPTEDEVATVRSMIARIRHRGPDGLRVEKRFRAVLGHARLAIIDLVTGDQPQSDESGRVRVVVNGEIYNYKELRRDLETRGHRFRTTSDIEVIPALWREHGLAFVDHLRGMFAIALIDEERGTGVLVRDRLGKKPLYWTEVPGGVAFASELRCFEELPGFERRADPQGLMHLLTWQYIPAPWTAYRGVAKLEAGQLLEVAPGTEPKTRRYWETPGEIEESLRGEGLLEQLQTTLDAATGIRLRSDVPLVGFLSGGIDSGLVMAAARKGDARVEALTVGFRGAEEDERDLTRLTARHLGLPLHEQEVGLDVEATVRAVLSHLDEPLGDSSTIPTWLVCQAARDQAKVALSGDGGDESFAGYALRYGHALRIESLRRWVPRWLRRPLAGGLASVWPDRADLPRPLRLRRVLAAASRELEESFMSDQSILRPEERSEVLAPEFRGALSDFDPSDWFRDLFRRAAPSDPLSRLLFVDRHSFLAEGVLAKVDRMSMAHGLEVRSPLLDQEMVTLASRVPPGEKLEGGRGKICLRRLARRHLPDEVVDGRKKGFAPPLDSWIGGPLQPMIRDLLLAPGARTRGLLDSERLAARFADHLEGRRRHGRLLWCALVLETWMRAREVAVA